MREPMWQPLRELECLALAAAARERQELEVDGQSLLFGNAMQLGADSVRARALASAPA